MPDAPFTPDEFTTRSHVVVLIDDDRVLLLREVRNGSVRYLAPGVASRGDETLGKAAERAAREQLGIEVVVDDLLFADTELGAEHYFFLARPVEPSKRDWDMSTPQEGTVPTPLPRNALLGYPVRPTEVARRVPRARRSQAAKPRTSLPLARLLRDANPAAE